MPIALRPAQPEDVPAIVRLIAANARKGGLLPRSEASIRAALKNFLVAEREGEIGATPNSQSQVVGCGSLLPFNTTLVELRSLAVDENLRGGGVGQKLVAALCDEARARNFGTIFALTRAVGFFEKCGFEVTSKENFPEKVWRDCVQCPMLANCDEVAVTMALHEERESVVAQDARPSNARDEQARIESLKADERFIPITAVRDMREAGEQLRVRAPVKKVVLAYSAGLDTACAVPWLREYYDCEVIAFVADVGQGGDFAELRARALQSGASQCIVEDLRNEFANEYLFPMLQSGAVYEGKYLLGSAIARPLIAKSQIEVAEREGADAVAHAATGKGNDQVRFELSYMALNPRLRIIAPWREWHIQGRDDALAYALAHRIPISQSAANLYSRSRNLWHLSHEGGALEDPSLPPDEAMYQWTVRPEDAPDQPEFVEIEFVSGIPKKVNGRALGGADLIETLNVIGARHGVGRADLVENRLIGMKAHGAYESPGGAILFEAHQALEQLTLDRETAHFKQVVALQYADAVYNGQWFTPLRDALQAFITVTQRDVTGSARVKLYKGAAICVGRTAAYSLYREDLATYLRDGDYNDTDAEGFIRLYGLPLRVKAQLDMIRAARTARSQDAKS